MSGDSFWSQKVALVTGGSAGLGLKIAASLARRGVRLAIAARDRQRLDHAARQLQPVAPAVIPLCADVTVPADVQRMVDHVLTAWGRMDVLVTAAGQSSRGTVLQTPVEEFERLWRLNLAGTLLAVQAAAPALIRQQGHIVLIGSLAAKAAAPCLGGYPTSKFAVAALAHQLRLELGRQGVHVLFVCPGPIARPDAGHRYDHLAEGIPPQARQPGGGVRLPAIDPGWLAERIVSACRRRRCVELVVPARARWLFALAQIAPRWADRLILKRTAGRDGE